MINVTKTFLPPQKEYQAILKRAWDKGWITNRGVLVQELEAKLKAYLGVGQIITTTNGTLPLQIAIKSLKLKGEIITTPFSYVATTSSIVWEGCKPVFVDIHPDYLTIDETQIEAAITPNTSAILATHVFGNPCHVDAIEAIAKKHDLIVIYDAAHGFGVKYKNQSIFNYGDVSTCSFHATKVFHTGEGGALFCKQKYFDNLYYHHNFGHDGHENFHGLGINAKISELQAAMGLVVLDYMKDIFSSRKQTVQLYRKLLLNCSLKQLKLREHTEWNFSYFPIILENADHLNEVKSKMNAGGVFPRRYFYPSLNTLPYIDKTDCINSESISSRILCLPLWAFMDDKDVYKVVDYLL